MLENFRSLRKLRWPIKSGTGECSRQDAKNAKFGVDFFLAAFAGFARDNPIWVAALPRWVLCGQIRFSFVLFASFVVSPFPFLLAARSRRVHYAADFFFRSSRR
jgi:hypothetical protein